MRNLLKQSKIKTEGGVSAGGKTPTLSFAGDYKKESSNNPKDILSFGGGANINISRV
jgi:hypothetical protein